MDRRSKKFLIDKLKTLYYIIYMYGKRWPFGRKTAFLITYLNNKYRIHQYNLHHYALRGYINTGGFPLVHNLPEPHRPCALHSQRLVLMLNEGITFSPTSICTKDKRHSILARKRQKGKGERYFAHSKSGVCANDTKELNERGNECWACLVNKGFQSMEEGKRNECRLHTESTLT
ncbi:hypothetical protein CAPTEDRAFT_210521 [Capitella teleta]|uniref:Uncharacterized protein n=1 Tax=Capitella teleta TaxID=283909 RepID=R7VL22_CAPTE|nr:hypothetical protein CAPTEDRAFT_210521 [Capitella teleta]|eukprot:ELU17230.1 hypothetical protein CAPTEDRAFT_210521 [Capitella teleta]